MTDEKLVRFVTRQLDAGVERIGRDRRERLKLARETALEHQVCRGEARFAGALGMFHVNFFTRRAMTRTTALLLLTLGIAYWHANHYIVELEELDSAILTDDMPMDVITDKGFDTWLKSSAEH